MSEEIKVSASDRSLIKIIDDANYSGYGKAVTAEIERLQTKIAALEAEVERRLRKVESKMLRRLESYKVKLSNAEGTDKINQGAKIKATIECLQDVQCEINTALNSTKGDK